MAILKIYPLALLIFSLLFSTLSQGSESDIEESAFLIKYKTPELQLRAIKKMEDAKTFLSNSTQKVEALTPEWVKISGNPQNMNRILQMQKKEIEYIQPDFKINLIEDYQLNNPKERADYLTYLQQNQQIMASSKYSDNTKISVLSFIEMSNIEPQNVINLNLMELVFVKCNNEKTYDFSNYSNIQTTYFTIKMDGMKELSNVSYLIENDDVKIQEFEIIKNHTRLSELCYIINEFVGLDDKKETIMDFTLRMIDNGFEDML